MSCSPDYSIYLVTDSTMIPDSSTFLSQVKQAVDNGVTIVQLREKTLLTRDFVERAKKVLEITRPKGIPLIINDRIDVALAVDAEGVHVGQDDMSANEVRRLIGPDKLLGVSCASEAETSEVCTQGVANYVGLGTLYPTNTKKTKSVSGPIGNRSMVKVLKQHNKNSDWKISCVAIGGINQSNVAKVRYQCQIPGQKIDGVAIVSCIMTSEDAAKATKDLLKSYHAPFSPDLLTRNQAELTAFKAKPLVHHITNNVVKNFSANVTLSVGGSPIMSELPEEFDEFASLDIPASLVVNLGTPTPALMEVFTAGLQTYNSHGKPVVFDPVAAGASRARLESCKELLNAGQFTVIKGNMGEIMALQRLTLTSKETETRCSNATMQGVDSIAELDESQATDIALRVSQEFRAIVVVSGARNIVAEFGKDAASSRIEIVEGGNPIMGSITGAGCALGSTIGCYIASAAYNKCDMWRSVVEAVKFYNEAGSRAGQISKGPGDFSLKFLDELFAAQKRREAQC